MKSFQQLTKEMNASSCVSEQSTEEHGLLPLWFCAAVIILNIVILIGNLASFSLLLRFIWTSSKKERTPSHVFFIYISIVSMGGSIIGIPISIISAATRLQESVLTTVSHFIQSRFLYLTFSLVIHYFACITTERYLTITSKTEKISTRQSMWAIAIVTAYVVVLWLIIILDDVCLFTKTNCSSVIWNIFQSKKNFVTCLNGTTVVNSSDSSQLQESTSRVPLIVISIWMTICILILNVTTLTTLHFIKMSVRRAMRDLRVSSTKFETKRLKVVCVMGFIFCSLWIPYGVSAGITNKIDTETHYIMQTLTKTACYASFSAIPATVFVMDKRFSQYIKSYFRKNKVSIELPAHLPRKAYNGKL